MPWESEAPLPTASANAASMSDRDCACVQAIYLLFSDLAVNENRQSVTNTDKHHCFPDSKIVWGVFKHPH